MMQYEEFDKILFIIDQSSNYQKILFVHILYIRAFLIFTQTYKDPRSLLTSSVLIISSNYTGTYWVQTREGRQFCGNFAERTSLQWKLVTKDIFRIIPIYGAASSQIIDAAGRRRVSYRGSRST